MTAGLISIVVPAWNAAETVGQCVRALCKQDYEGPYEVIVVDDGSTDATAAAARAAGANVITTPNRRPAAARNTGVSAARGEIVCFTDADCVPCAGWLRQISAPFSDPSVVAAKGIYATRQRQIVARFVQLEYEDKYDLLRPQPTIDFVDTYSCAYRRDVLLASGGFDERFDYLEDQELSFRLAAQGYRMVFQETAVVEHHHSPTLRAYLRKKAIIGYWKAQVVRRFPARMVRDSHTPQVMKAQMLLAALWPVTLAWGIAGLLWRPERAAWVVAPAALVLMIFLATTLPFVAKAWPKDRAVALASPGLLFGRAAALGWGYLRGVASPRAGIGESAYSEIAGWRRAAKRGMDVAGAIVGLVFTAILWPCLALLIKLDSDGPVLFHQERVGAKGRPFRMVKFRTMVVGADEQLPALASTLGLGEPVLKLDDDPRITGAGRFLRRWSLDELPQFWNVLKGEMSLVGPRPEEPRVVAHYTDRERRLAMRPGITGPMQVSGRADLSPDDRARLELDYLQRYSLRRDLVILLRTIPVVLRGAGAR